MSAAASFPRRKPFNRTATREDRPFCFDDEYLADVGFRLSPSMSFQVEGTFSLDEIAPGDLAPAVRLHIPRDPDYLGIGYGSAELQLYIVVENRKLQDSIALGPFALERLPSEIYELDGKVVDPSWWTDGTIVQVTLVLAEDQGEVSGAFAWRRGHWLARKEFSVTSPRMAAEPTIIRMTPDQFKTEGLHPNTAFVARVDGDAIAFTDGRDRETIALLVARDMYDSLAQPPKSRSKSVIADLMYVYVIAKAIRAGVEACEGEIQEGSLLESLTRTVARGAALTTDELIASARGESETALESIVQAEVGFRDVIQELAVRGD